VGIRLVPRATAVPFWAWTQPTTRTPIPSCGRPAQRRCWTRCAAAGSPWTNWQA